MVIPILERKPEAEKLQETIRQAKADGDREAACECIRIIRGEKLWLSLGFKSFNDYAKNGCPYSSNYAYKMSAPIEPSMEEPTEPPTESDLEAGREALLEMVENPAMREVLSSPAPNACAAEDRTNQAPQCIIEAPVTDLRGNVLTRDMAKLFSHAKIHFDILNEAIHKIRQTLRDLTTVSSGASFAVHNRMAVLMQHLHDIEGIVSNCRPYSVCISCSGNRRKCIACGGVGFITEQQYIDATTTRRRG